AMLGRQIARRVDAAPIVTDAEEEAADYPRVIIVGLGRVGRLVAQMLDRHDKPYVAIDSDADLVDRRKREGYRAVFGNAARRNALDRVGIGRAPAVVLTMDEPVLAQRMTKKLRATYPDLPIFVRARDYIHAGELY